MIYRVCFLYNISKTYFNRIKNFYLNSISLHISSIYNLVFNVSRSMSWLVAINWHWLTETSAVGSVQRPVTLHLHLLIKAPLGQFFYIFVKALILKWALYGLKKIINIVHFTIANKPGVIGLNPQVSILNWFLP